MKIRQHVPPSQLEAGPSLWPVTTSLAEHMSMMVSDMSDLYDAVFSTFSWSSKELGPMKPFLLQSTISMRQQWKGYGPLVEIWGIINTSNDINKDSPGNMINDPTLIQEREGEKRKHAAEMAAVRSKPVESGSSIRGMDSHWGASHAVDCSLPRWAERFDVCPTSNPFLIQTLSKVQMIPGNSCMCEQHAILHHIKDIWSQMITCLEIRAGTPTDVVPMLAQW